MHVVIKFYFSSGYNVFFDHRLRYTTSPEALAVALSPSQLILNRKELEIESEEERKEREREGERDTSVHKFLVGSSENKIVMAACPII